MKKQNILVLCLMVIAIMSGCSSDFLDKTPPSQITPEQYLWDESQLASYSINLYTNLPAHGNWSYGTFGIDQNTDNMASMGYNNKYVPGQWRVASSGGVWDFSAIRRCNYFLNTVLPRWKAGKISGDASAIKQDIGEMYFFRAWSYWGKVDSLGDFPIVKQYLSDDSKVLIANSKRAPSPDVVRFIISDLDSATLLLAATSPDGARNRMTKTCAQLLKSRVTLFEATWLKYFKNTAFVPNGSGWPGATKDYNKSWQYPAGSIDAEISWLLDQSMSSAAAVADAVPLQNNNGILQQDAAQSTNPYFNMFSDVDLSPYQEVLLWRRYDKGLGITHNVPVYAEVGDYGIGLTRGYVDNFLMSNGLPIYAVGSGYEGDDYITDVRQNRDGRLWLFLKEPGQKNVLWPSSDGDHATAVEGTPLITSSTPETAYSTGYAIRKGLNYNQNQCGNGQGYTGSVVFRAAEAYLNYIEACYEKNHALDGKSDAYWREIRIRAKIDPDYNKTISATDMSQEAKNDWGAYSAGSLIDPTLYNIRRERRSELMAEGLREMDLRRWRAKDQMISTPYHIEGFKLWGPMQNWYITNGKSTLTYGSATANVSAPTTSIYLRPYEKTGKELVYNGYRWIMAHYLEPINANEFLLTSQNNDVSTSPIYQNPGWPTQANQGATGAQ